MWTLKYFLLFFVQKDKKNAHYIPEVNIICAKSCRFSWNAAIVNTLNILNIFINARYPSMSIIKLAYPQWICILIWNTLSSVQRPDLVGMNSGSALRTARQKLAPFRKGPCNGVCHEAAAALKAKALKHGVISEILPDAAALQPEARFPRALGGAGVRL